MAATRVPLDNDWEFEYDVTRKATATGEPEPAADLSSVSAHFSLEDGGSAIAGTSTALAERSGRDGRYFGILNMAALNTALGALVDTAVYEVFVVSGDAETSRECVVRSTREPS